MAELTEKQTVRRKKTLTSWTGALILIGAILLSNYMVSFLSIRLDTSEGGIYSLSKGSKQLMKKLDDTLLVRLVFSSKLPAQFKLNEQYIRDLLLEYKRASGGHMRIEYMDPGKSENIRREAIQLGVSPVQLDVREKDRREVKECFMGLSILFGDKTETIAFIQDTNGLEYEISQRIKKLILPEEIKVGFVSAGEAMTLESEPLQQLAPSISQRLQVESLTLEEPIPDDIKSLWVLGPKQTLTEDQVALLKSYVEKGGALGLFLDRYQVEITAFQATPTGETGLDSLLREWGISLGNGLVVDLRSDRIQVQSSRGHIKWINVVDYPFFPLSINLNRDHPVTKGIDSLSLPFVSPLTIDQEKPGLVYTSLVHSSQASWLNPTINNLSPLVKYSMPPNGDTGPFEMGLAIEGIGEGKGRAIVFGTSKFIRTDFPPRLQNYTTFLNLLDWSVQDEYLLSIRSKGVPSRPLKRMEGIGRPLAKFSLMFSLPILVLIIGLVIWRRQKTRRALLPLQYKEV